MPALNFVKEFAPLVELGLVMRVMQDAPGARVFCELPAATPFALDKVKTQTIRALRRDGRDIKANDRLFFYTGMRSKSCRKLGEARCRTATPVAIRRIDGKPTILRAAGGMHSMTEIPFSESTQRRIALADGFGSVEGLAQWFEKVHGLPFHGTLIKW